MIGCLPSHDKSKMAEGVPSSNANEYANDAALEMQWAMKTYHHAETYFNLLCALDPKLLKLTNVDDDIYALFRESFKDMKIDVIDEDEMKSAEGKALWRTFCNKFENQVEDFNFGTLLRLDCTEDYIEKNSTIVPRIQFLALEIARNREGYNTCLRAKFKPQTLKDINS